MSETTVLFDPQRLAEMRQELAPERLPFGHDFWARHLPTVDLDNFRGHQHYLYQDMNPQTFAALEERLRYEDEWQLLDALDEDGAFGALTMEINGKVVSRDLLDSIAEILYLRRILQWRRFQPVRVLDVGAGYGRLAHRLCEAMPNAEVWSTDAIAESLWLCESYLRYRGVDRVPNRTPVVSCLELAAAVGSSLRFDVATAIHSLSECTPEGVTWWLALLRRLRVPLVLYVANPVYAPLPQFAQNGYSQLDARLDDLDRQPFCLYQLIAPLP